MTEEEKVMARFMAEHAPGSVWASRGITQHVMTKKERKHYELR